MAPIIKSDNYSFKYETDKSVDENFTTWRILNHEERSDWGDDLLTWDEAKKAFETQYSVKVSTKNG